MVDTSKGRGVRGEDPPSTFTPVRATALYLAVALAFTWPLAAGLTRDIPWDLGDSLLNAWILTWDADHLLRFLSGDLDALSGFWNANIFHPEPLTLAYSEHLLAQAVQILPVYALTGNIILSYNLLFLSTFVLSGLGMFLLVRELTGSPRAAFVAGLIYAFAPLRVPQFAHLQVLSSQWMPFTLYGLRRYFETRRVKPLVGAGAALVAQNLSCGYFLLFFAPLVVAYVLFEVASRRLWLDVRVWGAMVATAAGVAAATVPFLLPYLALRDLGFGARTLDEVKAFAADVYSYWTAPPESRLWGRIIRAYPRAEGDLFPTISALILAGLGLAASAREAWRHSVGRTVIIPTLSPLLYVLLAASVVYSIFVLLILTNNGFTIARPIEISVKTLGPNIRLLAAITGLLLVVSERARSFARHWLASFTGFAVLAALLAFVLSLGLDIRTEGRAISSAAPYGFFYDHVPGFDGLRVPARYGMLVMMFLAIAAGHGAWALERRSRRGGAIVLALGFLAVTESFAAPIIINGTVAEGGYALPPPRVYTGASVPPVYHFLNTLPRDRTVIVEFPFGEFAYELRYVFYSTNHWHPLLNGYSGNFPLSYSERGSLLRHPLESPELAWTSLVEDGTTHAVIHESLYQSGEGKALGAWLTSHGAELIAEFEGDRVFRLK